MSSPTTSQDSTRKTRGRPRGSGRFGDIQADAQALGCSRIHLYFCLSGRRLSPGLLARWRALKFSQSATERSNPGAMNHFSPTHEELEATTSAGNGVAASLDIATREARSGTD